MTRSDDTRTPTAVHIRSTIAALPPYSQGRQAPPDGYKLSSNENPFEPLPSVVEAVHSAIAFNRYPDASAGELRHELAAKFAVPTEQVHIAAGSVSILAQLLLATVSEGDEVIFPWPSFEGYPSLCQVVGATTVPVPLTVDLGHDLDSMLAAVTQRTRLIVICSPNNPTGTVVSREDFASFHAAVPPSILIVLDEAYAEFVRDSGAVCGESYVTDDRYANVVVLRTFSKAHGLAALRVGYAVGHPRILAAARATAIPLSVTSHAQAGALASLRAEAAVLARVDALVERRERLTRELRQAGWPIATSQGNFIWLPAEDGAADIARAFQDQGLIVRVFPGAGVRVTVGEEETVGSIAATARSLSRGLRR